MNYNELLKWAIKPEDNSWKVLSFCCPSMIPSFSQAHALFGSGMRARERHEKWCRGPLSPKRLGTQSDPVVAFPQKYRKTMSMMFVGFYCSIFLKVAISCYIMLYKYHVIQCTVYSVHLRESLRVIRVQGSWLYSEWPKCNSTGGCALSTTHNKLLFTCETNICIYIYTHIHIVCVNIYIYIFHNTYNHI